jgi:hypothetical protein
MIDLNKIKKDAVFPPIIVIHGQPGVGKTTFACDAEKPIVILTERGLGNISVAAIPTDENGKPRVATSFKEVLECFAALGEQEHDFKTVVIDSLDSLEPLVWDATCKRLGCASIEAPGWGRGYREATNVEWKQFFDCVSAMGDYKNMTVIMIAHSTFTHIDDPERPAYDTVTLNLHKYISPVIVEKADVVGYAAQKVYTKVDDTAKKDEKRVRAVGVVERELRVSISPAFTAKTRYPEMPTVLPLDYDEFKKYLPGYVGETVKTEEAKPEEKKSKKKVE